MLGARSLGISHTGIDKNVSMTPEYDKTMMKLNSNNLKISVTITTLDSFGKYAT